MGQKPFVIVQFLIDLSINYELCFSLVIQWRFVDRMKKQMLSFMKGFNEIIPQRCIQMFDPKEFEVIIT